MHKPRMHLVASFDIAHLQYLDEQGRASQELPDFATPDTLQALYRQMALARLVDDRAVKLQRTGRLGTYPSTLGQEAIGVGTGSAMDSADIYCPYYRETGALLERGVDIEEILAIWGGDERGQCFQHAPEDLPLCVPIATQLLHAAGVGVALKYKNEHFDEPQRVAVASAGDGATSRGDFYEALNLAGVWQLPAVFVINNNQWAISVARSDQTASQTIAQKAVAAGIPGLQVDGNDVIAVRAAVADAVERARRGEGPTLIEALSYRLCDHTTADDAGRYRPAGELERAQKREPLARLAHYLESAGHWNEDAETELQRELAEILEREVKAYSSRSKDRPAAMFEHLYAELPEALYEQHDELAERGGDR
ncbi:pyruvate dehydrogenase (acetyl-transferring) E1 component subunit alpha [Microbulbifer halophilus]|uniref:Pyruvate dehydrogenase E1 component subunit alpha n=1 Tax=Microbulbifer halophilus TaxID=453963 RepID=A0ABW5EB51_9GAMM|nr:pyruvate dehydrogenase (acetyl-transferring) E1 component subunit alpha [Microbulbifer halophilus]MCW8125404.1 pyruvate dehydrogenase (acetyl-transferring) E1 component subunit alpha [Microbulbifer halophilus]